MFSIIVVLLLIINCLIVCQNPRKGIKIFMIFTLTLPPFKVGTLGIDFFLLGIIPILLILIFTKKLSYNMNYIITLLYIYIFVFTLSTLHTLCLYSHQDIKFSFIPLVGLICRFFFMFIITNKFLAPTDFLEVFKWVLIINLLITLYQLLIPSSVNIFYNLYYTDMSTPLSIVKKLGYFDRGYGTFGTPVILGACSFICFCIFSFMGNKHNPFKPNYLLAILSLILGLCALSKTPIFGSIIMIVLISFLKVLNNYKKINIFKSIKFIFVVVIGSYSMNGIIYFLNKSGFAIMYYLNLLKNPLSILKTRYDTETGILTTTLDVISENLILGVGANNIRGEFIGDSIYYTILHDTGIIGGLVIFILSLGLIVKCVNKENRRFIIVMLIAIGMIGLGSTIIFQPLGIIVIGFLYLLGSNIYNEKF